MLPRHFLDLSDHDSATLKALIADARKAQAGAQRHDQGHGPMPTARWTARRWR
jgi:hypothetical protein